MAHTVTLRNTKLPHRDCRARRGVARTRGASRYSRAVWHRVFRLLGRGSRGEARALARMAGRALRLPLMSCSAPSRRTIDQSSAVRLLESVEGPSAVEMQKESLEALQTARIKLDGIRAAKPSRATMAGDLREGRCSWRSLAREEIERRLKALSGWALDQPAIRKQYVFADFPRRSPS